jgi:type I restriction enzyme S subunit
MNEWNTYRVKDVAKFISEKANDCSLPYIALDNIVSWDGYYIPSDSTSDGNSNVCRKGDVLFGKLRPYLAKGYIPTQDSICLPEFIVLRPNDLINNSFLLYYLLSCSFVSYIKNQVAEVKMPRTNALQIGRVSFALPPIEEQALIVTYLDKECDKITREIDLLERKVGSYRRMKRSLINYAVMRGLDSKIKTKKSEGSLSSIIPFHWTEQRIKDIFTEVSIKGYPNEPMLCATQTRGVIPQSMYGNRVVTALTGLENMKLVEEGNFVISLHSFQGGIEYAYYRGIISAAYTILKLEEGQEKGFYKYFFKSASLIKLMKKCVTGIREGQNINYSILKYEMIPVPPLEEQREIVNYLDDKCSKIDSIIEKIELKIERLKELKRSLINEVVTGQRTIKTSDL